MSIEGQGNFLTLAQGCVYTKIQTGFSSFSSKYTCHKVHMSCFRIETYLLRRHTPKGHILLQLLEFPYLCGTTESCRISVGCLKQNGALQQLKIKIMMDVYQTVLANTIPNYNVFWVILTLSKSWKID